MAGKELDYISQAVHAGEIKGDGPFTAKCQEWMQEKFDACKVFLTHSGTAALEMAGVLAGVNVGDEVILPSYTFPSTANAFLMRGAKLVFAEIREDTLNIDENKIEGLITDKTKVICPVHYAGVGCGMDAIVKVAQKHNLIVVEDAAQGVMAKYQDKYLGTIGDIGAYSFHETKNYSSGEGGALILKDPALIEQAEIVWEKGTNRSQFFRGMTSKYSWVDLGGSYLPSEIIAAFLFAQLEKADEINQRRLDIWNLYYQGLSSLQEKGEIRLPIVPEDCEHNAHMFYLILENSKKRDEFIQFSKKNGVEMVFHYLPLHSSKMGKSLGYSEGDFPVSEDLSSRIVRFPFYNQMTDLEINKVLDVAKMYFQG